MSKTGWVNFGIVGLLWGIPYLFLKVAVGELEPSVIVISRTLIGALLLAPLAIKRSIFWLPIKRWPFLLLYSACELIGPWYLITHAEQKINSGLTGLLIATTPIWAAILASIFGDKTVWHKSRLFGLIVGFIGVIAVVGLESVTGNSDLISIAMVLIASMGYAYAINMVNRRIPEVPGLALNTWAMIITSIVFLPFAIVQRPTQMPSVEVVLSVIGLGVLCTALAFTMFFKVIAEIGPPRASLVTYLNTAVAVVLGIIILSEPITLGIVLGLPLVLIGSYFASRKPVA
jgi:drug/metabolite transporter (DMT)-like permease